MKKERELYDKFVDVLTEKLKGEPAPKELEIIMNFLKNNNIQAATNHQGLRSLASNVLSLPFDDEDEQPVKRVK